MAELTQAGHDAEMQEGESGQFDVLADGALVFSKERERRWPEPGEIAATVA